MLGRDHALTGAVVFAALAPVLHVPLAELPAGVVLGAGAGVLPDIDHPDSTIAESFGFLTEAFAKFMNFISGGHRHGTHSLIGVAVFTAGAWAAGMWQETSTPSRSRRKSQCRRRAWCSWTTKLPAFPASAAAASAAGTGSGVRVASRLRR
jgi:membrane-bound metal-dependent hydrolase YbcI (DUF457 family)